MDKYYINNVQFCAYDVKVTDATNGLTSRLERKESVTTDWPDQHGVRRDYSEPFFKEGRFAIGIACFSRSKYDAFFAALSTPYPVRITRETGRFVQNMDVYLLTPRRAGWWDCAPFYDVLEFSEDMPVKLVYKCAGKMASIKIVSENSLQVSWGDNTFTTDVFDDTLTHTYTDEVKNHYIIVAGRVSEAVITTNMRLVEKVLD